MIHSSDWHLGKTLYGHDRLPEQKLFLQWLLEFIQKEQIDYLLLSGDIFDRPTPSTATLSVYYQFLADLSRIPCKLFMIGGNHDSGRLLECPTPLYDSQKVKLIGDLGELNCKKDLERFVFKEDIANFTLLPYFKNHELYQLKELLNTSEREAFEKLNHFEKLSYLFNFLVLELKNLSGEGVNILLAHHLFGQVIPSGSEVDIALCGPNTFSLANFSHFDYLALGHIHSPHCLQKHKPRAIYSGAPLVYRFGEQENKALSLIEVDTESSGKLEHKFITIPSWRKLVSISYEDAPPSVPPSILPTLLEVCFKAKDFTSARMRELELILKEKDLLLLNVNIEKNLEEKIEQGKLALPQRDNDLKQMIYAFLKEKDLNSEHFDGIINQFFQEKDTQPIREVGRGSSIATTES